MRLREIFLVITLIALYAIRISDGASNSRTLCYSGSSLYQSFIQDCDAEDSSYTGRWYCSEVEVCEAYISGTRDCMVTKGCAKEEQCFDTGSAATGTMYTGSAIENSGSHYPGGMEIRPSCCSNPSLFNDDDSALDYSLICNSASPLFGSHALLTTILSIAIAITTILFVQ